MKTPVFIMIIVTIFSLYSLASEPIDPSSLDGCTQDWGLRSDFTYSHSSSYNRDLHEILESRPKTGDFFVVRPESLRIIKSNSLLPLGDVDFDFYSGIGCVHFIDSYSFPRYAVLVEEDTYREISTLAYREILKTLLRAKENQEVLVIDLRQANPILKQNQTQVYKDFSTVEWVEYLSSIVMTMSEYQERLNQWMQEY